LILDFAIILILIIGIRQFRSPKGARIGNLTAAFALLCALVLVFYRNEMLDPAVLIAALMVGSLLGWAVAMRVNMIQIPAMVAFQHGAGGIAAFLVSFVELTRLTARTTVVGEVSGLLGLIIGAATFSGSMIASGKLANKIKQTPTVLPKHGWILQGLILAIIVLSVITGCSFPSRTVVLLILLVILSVVLGIVFSIRIGGADMPVLISFLNATAGLAAAFCGIIIQNRLLIACGATVAASGSILTHVMCKAMNRDLLKTFAGFQAEPTGAPPGSASEVAQEMMKMAPSPYKEKDPLAEAAEALRQARSVIIIPGYGMALAQAQFKVAEMADCLEELGKEVKFAIHPVAGRMPGHMNVLLAEAEVSYDKLIEMDDINPHFKDTDLAIVVGACDVVNPAAIRTEGTPISGMPILMAHEARQVLVCNLDEKPGYSGVDNPLYQEDKAITLLGDAKSTVSSLLDSLSQ
jgi:NAD(P) transhydrogenase subunit beta